MIQRHKYKPRYQLSYITKTKIWPYKNSYLRRFYDIRAFRVKRGGLFRRCVLVAKSRKWIQARRFFKAFSRRRIYITGGAGKTAFGRPRKRRYRNSFYIKQQLRFFYGKVKEEAFRQFYLNYRSVVGKPSTSFFSALESRLDRVFFRRRLLPTVFACHQFIQHKGLLVNGFTEKSPRAQIFIGDTVTVPNFVWKPFYWDLFCRIYYRRWGLYIYRRRLFTQLKKKLFLIQGRRFRRKAFSRALSLNGKSPSRYSTTIGYKLLASKNSKLFNSKSQFSFYKNIFSVKSFFSRFGLFSGYNKINTLEKKKKKNYYLIKLLKYMKYFKNKKKPGDFFYSCYIKQNQSKKFQYLYTFLKRYISYFSKGFKKKKKQKVIKFVTNRKVPKPVKKKHTKSNLKRLKQVKQVNVYSISQSFNGSKAFPFVVKDFLEELQITEQVTNNPFVFSMFPFFKFKKICNNKSISKTDDIINQKGIKNANVSFTDKFNFKKNFGYIRDFQHLFDTSSSQYFTENIQQQSIVNSIEVMLFLIKIYQLQKFFLARRLRKVLFPKIKSFWRFKKKNQKTRHLATSKESKVIGKNGNTIRQKQVKNSSFAFKSKYFSSVSVSEKGKKKRVFTRSFFRQYISRLRKKQKRLNKIISLKSVHFFIPAYLHRDFRTLRAVKIKSASLDEIYHPFRGSFAKRRAFYQARGR